MKRAMFAFEKMRDSKSEGCILFPVAFMEKGLSGYSTHEGEAFGNVLSVVDHISRCGKIPLVFANSVERFSRSPPDMINMIDDIQVLGGVVVTASQYGAENEWPRVLWAYSEWQTLRLEIAEDSTHVNPCKNDGRSAEDHKRQRAGAISKAKKISTPGTPLNKFVRDATLAGLDILDEETTLINAVGDILDEDLMKSLQGPSSQLPAEGADCVSASQMGWNVAPDVAKSIDDFKDSGHIILPTVEKDRRSNRLGAYIATVALVLRGNVSAVVMTTSSRSSGHVGYIVLLARVCEVTNTKLVFSQHLGGNVSNEEVAVAEQDRYDSNYRAYERYLAVCEEICKRERLHPEMKKIADTRLGRTEVGEGH